MQDPLFALYPPPASHPSAPHAVPQFPVVHHPATNDLFAAAAGPSRRVKGTVRTSTLLARSLTRYLFRDLLGLHRLSVLL
jgi:hypothetical protein